MLHQRDVSFCFLVAGCFGAFSESSPAQTDGRDSLSRYKTHHGGELPDLFPKNCQAVSKAFLTTPYSQVTVRLHMRFLSSLLKASVLLKIQKLASICCICQYVIRSSSERQLQLLCAVYGVIQQGNVPMSSMLQAMMDRVLLPLVTHCSTKALSDFFVANVSDITALLLSRFTKVCFLTLMHLKKFIKIHSKHLNM